MHDIVKINGIDCNKNICIFDIFIADICNFNCLYCYNSLPRTNKCINVDKLVEWIIAFKEKFKHDAIFIQLIGGEPTLHPNLLNFVEKISKCENIFISIFSNFSATLNKYILLLNYSNVDLKLTWHGSFEYNSFFRKLAQIDEKFSNRISVKVMLEKCNENNSFLLIDMLKSIKLQTLELSTIKDGISNIEYNAEIYQRYINILSKMLNLQKINVVARPNISLTVTDNYFLDNLQDNTNFKLWLCNAGKTYLYININGDIIPCPEGNKNVIGSIFDKNIHFRLKNSICNSQICSCLYYLSKQKIFKLEK